MIEWKYDDGGRSEAGYRGKTGDCVCRAIVIATGQDYKTTYQELARMHKKVTGERTARKGISRKIYEKYLSALGWKWTPTMGIGTGCKVHLRKDELPHGRLIVCLSKHMAAVIDGVVHDIYDPSRLGSRCVYGYWSKS
jgi:hypothetical protein